MGGNGEKGMEVVSQAVQCVTLPLQPSESEQEGRCSGHPWLVVGGKKRDGGKEKK